MLISNRAIDVLTEDIVPLASSNTHKNPIKYNISPYHWPCVKYISHRTVEMFDEEHGACLFLIYQMIFSISLFILLDFAIYNMHIYTPNEYKYSLT
jgi:hypothetical protein